MMETPQTIGAAALAYLGDAAWELLVRERLVRAGTAHPSEASLSYVTAAAQSDALEAILPLLTEEEAAVFRRGRNCVHANPPRHATTAQYRRATGLEALFGYLALRGETARMADLFAAAYPEEERGKIPPQSDDNSSNAKGDA